MYRDYQDRIAENLIPVSEYNEFTDNLNNWIECNGMWIDLDDIWGWGHAKYDSWMIQPDGHDPAGREVYLLSSLLLQIAESSGLSAKVESEISDATFDMVLAQLGAYAMNKIQRAGGTVLSEHE